jgi:uncharacterized membrane protein YkvA (DUF1232 family)
LSKEDSVKSWFENLTGKARTLRGQTYMLYLAYRHPATPWYAKIFAAVVVGYAFSPIDLIPDFIPVLGYLDDILLVPLGITLALRMIPEEALNSAREQVVKELDNPSPHRWVIAALIVMIWLLLLAMIVILMFRFIRTIQLN